MRDNCVTRRKQVQAFLDGEIARGSAEEATLQAHLDACPECRRLLEELQGTRALLPCWQPPAASPDASARFTDALAERMARRTWWPLPAYTWALGCILLIAIAGLAIRGFSPTHPPQVQVALRPLMPHKAMLTYAAGRKLAKHTSTDAKGVAPMTEYAATTPAASMRSHGANHLTAVPMPPVDAASHAEAVLAETDETMAMPVAWDYNGARVTDGAIIRINNADNDAFGRPFNEAGDAVTINTPMPAPEASPDEAVIAMLTETQ